MLFECLRGSGRMCRPDHTRCAYMITTGSGFRSACMRYPTHSEPLNSDITKEYIHMTSTTQRYRAAASQSASTAEKVADVWAQGTRRLTDYMLPGVPQVGLAP